MQALTRLSVTPASDAQDSAITDWATHMAMRMLYPVIGWSMPTAICISMRYAKELLVRNVRHHPSVSLGAVNILYETAARRGNKAAAERYKREAERFRRRTPPSDASTP